MSEYKHPQPPPEAATTFSKVEKVGLMVFFIAAFPQRILFRKRFGERHLRFFHASFLSVTIYILWIATLATSIPFLRDKNTVLTWFFFLAVTLMSTVHALEITFRKKTDLVHSQYTGEPHILKLLEQIVPEWVIAKLYAWDTNLEIFTKMYIEPALGLIAGMFIFSFDRVLGMIITVSAVGNYVISQYAAAMERDRYLDVIDGMIEAEQMQRMLSGKPGSETKGFERYSRSKVLILPPTSEETEEDKDSPTLSPELEKLLNEKEPTEAPEESTTSTVKVGSSPVGNEKIPRPKGRPRKDSSVIYP